MTLQTPAVFPSRRYPRASGRAQAAARVRSAAARSDRDDLRLPCGVAGGRRSGGRPMRVRAFEWFLGGNDLAMPLVDPETGSCCDGLHPTRQREPGRGICRFLFSGSGGDAWLAGFGGHAKPARCALYAPEFFKSRQLRGTLTQNMFFNRQALHLRPDPARVLVRPFKPATEPRDLNPTDRTRANHIVDRVLALTRASPASWRRCSRTSSGATATCSRLSRHERTRWKRLHRTSPFHQDQRRLIGAYFLHEYSFEAAALFNPRSCPSRSIGVAARRPPVHSQPARGR